jgi:hypothetical protein
VLVVVGAPSSTAAGDRSDGGEALRVGARQVECRIAADAEAGDVDAAPVDRVAALDMVEQLGERL